MKFTLENFQVDRNDFLQKFQGHQSNGKVFAKRYRQITPSSVTAIPPSTSGVAVQALATVVDAEGDALTDHVLQTPAKKGRITQTRKSITTTPEGAELPSPAKSFKPNTLDKAIEAHYLGMLTFYTT